MGLFSKLFGKKKNEPIRTKAQKPLAEAPKTKKQNLFLTNASEFGLGDIQLGISGKMRVDGILAFAEFDKIAKARGLPFEFNVMYTTLLEEGALTIPVVCSIGDEKYSLYFIYQEEDLLKYKDLVNHVHRTAYPNLIYFSSIPIYDGYKPKPIIEPFQLADLRVENDAKIAGEYAMWWKTEDDPVFHSSKTQTILSQMYDIFKGYETYLTGYVLRQTRIKKEVQLERVKLPNDNVTYILAAPEGKHVIMSLSLEKGIRFLFPIQTTSHLYRERFLKGALVDFMATVIPLKQHNAPTDEPTDPNSYDWFEFLSSVIKQKEEAGESIDHIGVMQLNSDLN
ncbi:MAG: hypothetical protein P1U56_03110 [Saprospiraceae bacterium]|nr:hypothetical protein [Saprospiraceae bacterium]